MQIYNVKDFKSTITSISENELDNKLLKQSFYYTVLITV